MTTRKQSLNLLIADNSSLKPPNSGLNPLQLTISCAPIRLLDAAISDASFTDVHDRAMMYYRLLQFDVNEANRVLTKSAQVEVPFVEETASELQVMHTNASNSHSHFAVAASPF